MQNLYSKLFVNTYFDVGSTIIWTVMDIKISWFDSNVRKLIIFLDSTAMRTLVEQ